MKTILSLCDFSGTWSDPYREHYNVIQIDPKLNMTAQQFLSELPTLEVHGILMAPPCTDFTNAGSRYWPDKDADGTTQQSIEIVKACLAIKDHYKPKFWALENPVGRLQKLIPELGKYKLLFHPCHYAGWADDEEADSYTKRTCLWGDFNPELEQDYRPPIYIYSPLGTRSSKITHMRGGNNEATKAFRSNTPIGFARAFRSANP